ncbi:L,D-transpeptidase family protein [Streptomyces sp. NPDC127066]|uniref:L,D-transpeptidase family protein n=1 Tax=Streptomyces sp. NPDC127066 TaxID=3347125 RepID=UPI003665DE22
MSRRRACRGIAVLLAVVAAVPAGAVAAASAPLPPAAGRVGEPWPGAAGGPRPSRPGDAPDGRLPSAVSAAMGMPAAGRGVRDVPGGMRTPVSTAPVTSGSPGSGPVTFAPPGSTPTDPASEGPAPAGFAPVGPGPVTSGPDASPSSATAGARPAATCGGRGGPYQRQAERWLGLRVDGKQSAADCRAIRAFQRKHGIEPATGTAGPATWTRMRTLSAPARSAPHTRTLRGCPVRSYRVACVDLTHKRTWVQQRGRILYGPVPMRSGGVRHPTRTGWFRIYWRHRHHWSTLYDSPMPYAQFFSGGQAFHAVRGSIRTVGGSMGCVNLRLADARALWKVLRKGDHVYVWGRRPRG